MSNIFDKYRGYFKRQYFYIDGEVEMKYMGKRRLCTKIYRDYNNYRRKSYVAWIDDTNKKLVIRIGVIDGSRILLEKDPYIKLNMIGKICEVVNKGGKNRF